MCVSQTVKPEPGVAVTPGRVSSRSGSNPSRAHRLADAHSAFDSPTLELSNATLASSGAQFYLTIIFTEFWHFLRVRCRPRFIVHLLRSRPPCRSMMASRASLASLAVGK